MYTKSASPEFINKIVQYFSSGDKPKAPVHVPKKPDFNPTGLEDMGVGAGAGIAAGGIGAAIPGGMAVFKERRLSQIPGETTAAKDGLAAAMRDLFSGSHDPKMKILMLKSMVNDHTSSMAGLADEAKELKSAIPGLIKHRNLALKLGIPIGAGLGALAGLGYYNSRPAV